MLRRGFFGVVPTFLFGVSAIKPRGEELGPTERAIYDALRRSRHLYDTHGLSLCFPDYLPGQALVTLSQDQSRLTYTFHYPRGQWGPNKTTLEIDLPAEGVDKYRFKSGRWVSIDSDSINRKLGKNATA